MVRDYSARSIASFVAAMRVAAALTMGAYCVLHAYVLDRPDPLYKQGGLTPAQTIKGVEMPNATSRARRSFRVRHFWLGSCPCFLINHSARVRVSDYRLFSPMAGQD
jgi:hypothetical protein